MTYQVCVKNMETYSVEANSEEDAIVQAIDYFCDDKYYGSEFTENVAKEDCEIVGWEEGDLIMINLKTALKLIQITNNEIVFFRKKNQILRSEFEELTEEDIINKYDLKKTKVIEILPYFDCGEYEGFLFTII